MASRVPEKDDKKFFVERNKKYKNKVITKLKEAKITTSIPIIRIVSLTQILMSYLLELDTEKYNLFYLELENFSMTNNFFIALNDLIAYKLIRRVIADKFDLTDNIKYQLLCDDYTVFKFANDHDININDLLGIN